MGRPESSRAGRPTLGGFEGMFSSRCCRRNRQIHSVASTLTYGDHRTGVQRSAGNRESPASHGRARARALAVGWLPERAGCRSHGGCSRVSSRSRAAHRRSRGRFGQRFSAVSKRGVFLTSHGRTVSPPSRGIRGSRVPRNQSVGTGRLRRGLGTQHVPATDAIAAIRSDLAVASRKAIEPPLE